jgi:O-antigen ligase
MQAKSAARHLAPGAALGVIFVGLAAGGANTSELAALFSATLVALAIVAIAVAPDDQVGAALRANAVSAAAATAFLVWSLLTAVKLPLLAPDPLWRAFGFADGAVSISPYRTIEGAVSFLSAVAAFTLGALSVHVRADRDVVGRLIVIGTLGFSVYALMVQQSGGAPGRLMVNFGSANAAATLFGMTALFSAAFVLRAARGNFAPGVARAMRAMGRMGWTVALLAAPFAAGALVLSLLCLLLTASRGGILASLAAFGLFAALLVIGRVRREQGRASQAAFLWLSAFAALLFLIGGNFALERVTTLETDATVRTTIAQTHWRAFLDRPLVGHGLNTFHELNALYAAPAAYASLRDVGAAHNIYIQMLEETGLVGASLFAVMLAPPLFRAFSAALLGRSGAHWAAAACAAAALCLIHGMVDFGLQVPAIAAFFGFCLGAYSVRGRSWGAYVSDAPTPSPGKS